MTLEKALSYARDYHSAGIMEKNGVYAAADDYEEIDYAVRKGWNYLGHPTDFEQEEK